MSLKQAELALSTKILTNEQKQQILAETGLIATENTIQAELLQTTLAQAGLNSEKQNAILKDVGLMNAQTGELLTLKACTKAKLEEKLALHGVTGAQAENIISTLGLSSANETATVSFGLLTKSIWANIKAIGAWLVTNPVGWLILAGTAIAGVIAGIVSYNKHQEELRQEALDSAQAINEQSKAMDDLVSQYEAILDSEKTETEKIEELNEWKQTLADTYGITKDKLAELNLEREDGIKLLQEEIKNAKIKQQLDWQEANKKAISNAKNKIEHAPSFNRDGNVYGDGVDYWTGINYSISDEIKNLFDEVVQVDEFTVDFKINTDNAIDEYERLQSILTEIGKISIQRDLTESEQLLYNDIKTQVAYLETLKDDMKLYKQNISSEAMIKFEGYKLADDSYKNLGKDSYLSWRDGLLATADGDKALEKELLALAEKQFPDYAKYFNNLETAKKMFIGGTNPNSEYTARIKNYLESLSDEDLEIATKIPKLFADGLEGATAKIEAWKKDPNNVIKPTVDTKPLSELAEEISSKTKLINTAIDDMNDTGHISASTYAEIIEMGGNFADCLEIQNGQLVLNTERLKELETEEYNAAISANKLAIAHKALGINSKYDYEEWQKFKNQLEEENALYQILIDEIYGVNGSEDDGKKEKPQSVIDFENEYARRQHEINMGRMEEDEAYYDWLENAAKTAYSGLKDYEDELWKYEEEVHKGRIEKNKKEFEEAKKLREHWVAMGKDDAGNTYTEDDYYQWFNGDDGYKKYFEEGSDEYRQYKEEDYKWEREQDKKLYDEKIDNNEKLIKEINNTEYDNPLQKYDEVAKVIQDSIDITQQRINELVASGSGAVQDEIDSLQDDLDDLNDKLKENEKDRQKEQEDLWKTRVENEKTYWENLKKETEDYYDNRIKELQDIADEEERITKQNELQLKLMKAQDDLLKAKKNRNQLVFSNGGFEYDYDQEAIIKSMEAVADAQKEVNDNIRENEIQALEDKKDEKISGLDDLIKKIDEYIDKLNGKTVPTESDPEILKAVAENSKENEQNKPQNVTDFTPVTLESFLQDNGFKYNKEVVSAGYNLYEKVIGNSLSIPNEIAKNFSGTTYNNCTINKGISINNPSFSLIKGVSETKVRDIFDEEITNAFNIISDRIETEAIRVGNE